MIFLLRFRLLPSASTVSAKFDIMVKLLSPSDIYSLMLALGFEYFQFQYRSMDNKMFVVGLSYFQCSEVLIKR